MDGPIFLQPSALTLQIIQCVTQLHCNFATLHCHNLPNFSEEPESPYFGKDPALPLLFNQRPIPS